MKIFNKITTALKKTLLPCFTAILLLIGLLTGIENAQPENPQKSSAVMLCGDNPTADDLELN